MSEKPTVVRVRGTDKQRPADINLGAIVAVRYYAKPERHVGIYFSGRSEVVRLRGEQCREFAVAWNAYTGQEEDGSWTVFQ